MSAIDEDIVVQNPTRGLFFLSRNKSVDESIRHRAIELLERQSEFSLDELENQKHKLRESILEISQSNSWSPVILPFFGLRYFRRLSLLRLIDKQKAQFYNLKITIGYALFGLCLAVFALIIYHTQ